MLPVGTKNSPSDVYKKSTTLSADDITQEVVKLPT